MLPINQNTMSRFLDPFRFVLIAVADWMNQLQVYTIEFLREENRLYASNSPTARSAQ
jgi:hypothetical protein